MPALRDPEPSQDMRYVCARVKMIGRLGSLAGLNGHEFGAIHLAHFDQGVGQEGAEHDTWISGPARALGVEFRNFKRKTLFVYLDRLPVSSGLMENDANLVQ